MTILAIDGQYAGQRLSKLPKGYHCVAHFDNHPDIASCIPEYDRHMFVANMLDGVEEFTDEETAVRTVNHLRHGMLNKLGEHIVSLMCKTNEIIYDLQTARQV